MKLKIITFFVFLTQNLAIYNYWPNWGNYKIERPEETFYPQNISEVQNIISLAALKHKKIRIIGSCHSWQALLNTNGYIINTDKLNKVLEIDKKLNRIKVEAGIKIKDLIKILAKENLALPNQGFITEQSIAGAISTGTHGSGHTGCLSDFIVSFEIIDGFSMFHEISSDKNSDWLPYTRISLGTLGFIYSVTIQCEPLTILEHKREISTWADSKENFLSRYHENDYYMFMGHPTSDLVLHFYWNRTKKLPTKNFLRNLKDTFIMHPTLARTAINSLQNLPTLGSKLMEQWLLSLEAHKHREYSYKSLSPLKKPLTVNYYIEEEIGISTENFIKAIEQITELFKRYEEKGVLLIALITCRFVPISSSSILNPCFDRETAWITLNILNYFPEYKEFFEEFEKIMKPYNGRPHWGKYHSLNFEKVIKLYGNERIQSFNKVRKTLDPYNIFSNNLIENIFNE